MRKGLPPETGERRARRRGLFGAFKTWCKSPMNATNGGLLIAVVVLMAAGGWVLLGFQNASDNRVADVDFQRRVDAYQSDYQVYVAAIAAYDLCVDSVDRSDNNREQWELLADIIAALDPGTGKAIAFADQIREGPVLAQKPRVIGDCGPDPRLTPPVLVEDR